MSRDLRMLPMPSSARDEMEWAIYKVPVDLRFEVRMAIRKAYAAGYDQGHMDGGNEARADTIARKEQAAAAEEAPTD